MCKLTMEKNKYIKDLNSLKKDLGDLMRQGKKLGCEEIDVGNDVADVMEEILKIKYIREE